MQKCRKDMDIRENKEDQQDNNMPTKFLHGNPQSEENQTGSDNNEFTMIWMSITAISTTMS